MGPAPSRHRFVPSPESSCQGAPVFVQWVFSSCRKAWGVPQGCRGSASQGTFAFLLFRSEFLESISYTGYVTRANQLSESFRKAES